LPGACPEAVFARLSAFLVAALAQRSWRRHALMLIGILGFIDVFIVVHALQALRPSVAGIPVWVKLSSIIPVLSPCCIPVSRY
jgi:hypothetical protein